ncbi:MAG TPA: hypothetical protein VMF86_17155, partial [Stellaceae bacterium]|nr:hypothetical protein [Stellaceae bacterium]
MASIPGSQFNFYAAAPEAINVVFSPDGSNLPPPTPGVFNLEVLTQSVSVSGPAPGYQGVAEVTGDSTLNMLFGDYGVVDTTGGDTIIAGSGMDTINALVGNDTVTFGSTSATVYGGSGDSVQIGTAGVDTIVDASAGDTILGGAAQANITLAAGESINLAAQTGNATVNALAGSDSIAFGAHASTVYGGAGDTITGGSGTGQYIDFGATVAGGHTVTGGTVTGAEFLNDNTAFAGAGGQDTVYNFDQAAGDRIIGTPTNQQAAVLASAHDVNGSAVVQL